jgi:hypothetical protein
MSPWDIGSVAHLRCTAPATLLGSSELRLTVLTAEQNAIEED